MPPLSRRPPPPNARRARVLALAADLAEDLAAVELDAVDGEFYWRCCRADLLDAVETLGAGGPRPVGFDPDEPIRREEPRDVFDYLRQGLRFAEDVMELADEASRLYPAVVWRRLLDGERVAMRAAEAEVRHPYGDAGPGGPPSLILKVFSGAWTGEQVEEEVRRLAAGWPELAASGRPTPRGGGAVAVRIAFALGDGVRDPEDAADDGRPGSPYVEVSVPVPLPPEKAIAREYDALVRGELKWHRHLRGGGSKQEKEVAVRSWTVGLLVAEGTPFPEAMRVCASRTGLLEVSQTRFGQDRQKLLERVPEAKAYLFVRGQGTEADTRAMASSALASPAGAEALANPANPLPPLQPPAAEEGTYT